MRRCRSELNGDAAALFSMARNVFGGIGISISTALITDHQQIRQAHLIDNLSPGNQRLRGPAAAGSAGAARTPARPMAQAMHNAPGQVFQMLQTQTAMLAYNDVFLITGVRCLPADPDRAADVRRQGQSRRRGALTMTRTRLAASAALLLGLGACTVGPDFTPPKPPDVQSWNDPVGARPQSAGARQPGQQSGSAMVERLRRSDR